MIGSFVNQYQILERLGDGGMGSVYKARDTKLKRKVALKFLHEHLTRDKTARRRFIQEARAASALDHPNICTIHEIGESDTGRPFIAMSCYEGGSLHGLIARGPLGPERAVELARQIAAGLAAAHAAGVLHRDIKPANVLLAEDGTAKIVDFGLAKIVAGLELTSAGTFLGTPGYAAPEMVMGLEVDARADIWSLGSVFYEMLTGHKPFRGQSLGDDPAPLSYHRAELPDRLQPVVDRMLAHDPKRRYASAAELRVDLDRLQLGEASIPTPVFTTRGPGPAASAGGRAPQLSLAVLSFRDMSSKRDQEYLCDGIAEELIGALSKIPELRIAARTSSFQFKAVSADVRTIGARLRVAAILDGSVRKAGSRLRISAHLVNVADGYDLWSESWDREIDDVFAIQDEIARAIVAKLRGEISIGPEGRAFVTPKGDPEAFTLYLRGRYAWNQRTLDELRNSVGFFSQAIEVDPGLAKAHAGLADAYSMLAIYGGQRADELMPKAIAAAQRALELDPELGEAHAALGSARSFYAWEWERAEGDFRTAIANSPSYATAHQWYAINNLAPRGRFEDALAEMAVAREIDPVSPVIGAGLGLLHYYQERYDEAQRILEETLELDGRFAAAHLFLGRVQAERGDPGAALQALERAAALSGQSDELTADLARAHGLAGRADEADRLLGELLQRRRSGYVSPSLIAQVEASQGRAEAALDHLEQALEEHAPDLAWLAVRPVFKELRATPRCQAVLAAMDLV